MTGFLFIVQTAIGDEEMQLVYFRCNPVLKGQLNLSSKVPSASFMMTNGSNVWKKTAGMCYVMEKSTAESIHGECRKICCDECNEQIFLFIYCEVLF